MADYVLRVLTPEQADERYLSTDFEVTEDQLPARLSDSALNAKIKERESLQMGHLLQPYSNVPHATASISQEADPSSFGTFITAPHSGGFVTYFGGNPIVNTAGVITRPTGANNQQSLYLRFYTNAPKVAAHLVMYGATDFTVYVDGMPVPSVRPFVASDTSKPFIVVDNMGPGVHEVTMVIGPTVEFIQLVANEQYRFWPAPKPAFTLALTGDSYTDLGLNPYYGGLARALHHITGWEIVQLGQGGTGYTNEGVIPDGEGGFTKPDPSKNVFGHSSRISALRSYNPDAVLVVGSVNDGSASSSVLEAAAADFYSQLSDLHIIVLGVEPLGVGGDGTANGAIRAAALAAPNVVTFVDWWNEDWLTGTGNASAPAGDGNQDFFVGLPDGSDTIHPNEDGERYIASRIEPYFRRTILYPLT